MLKIYDVLGRDAATLVNERQTPGNHRITFNPEEYGLASGVLYYALRTDERIQWEKMIYLR
jgi:hypothetical protein